MMQQLNLHRSYFDLHKSQFTPVLHSKPSYDLHNIKVPFDFNSHAGQQQLFVHQHRMSPPSPYSPLSDTVTLQDQESASPSRPFSPSISDAGPQQGRERTRPSVGPRSARGDARRVMFFVVEGGTLRGKRKLADSSGYSYTIKEENAAKTRWHCSKRSKTCNCRAAVVQRGSTFTPGGRRHCHPPDTSSTPSGQRIIARLHAQILNMKSSSSSLSSQPPATGDATHQGEDGFTSSPPALFKPDHLTSTSPGLRLKPAATARGKTKKIVEDQVKKTTSPRVPMPDKGHGGQAVQDVLNDIVNNSSSRSSIAFDCSSNDDQPLDLSMKSNKNSTEDHSPLINGRVDLSPQNLSLHKSPKEDIRPKCISPRALPVGGVKKHRPLQKRQRLHGILHKLNVSQFSTRVNELFNPDGYPSRSYSSSGQRSPPEQLAFTVMQRQ